MSTPTFDFSSMSRDQLIATLQSTQTALDTANAALASKPAKAPKEPKPKTPEQLANEAKRQAHQAVTLEAEGTTVRQIQDADRFAQIDAGAKLLRAIPWNRVAHVVASLADEVAAVEGTDAASVVTAALVRKERAKKVDPAPATPETSEGQTGEPASTDEAPAA